MVWVTGLFKQKKESEILTGILRNLAAVLTDEKWDIQIFCNLKEFESYISDKPLINMVCYDISVKGALEYLEMVRSRYREAFLLLIAEDSLSPLLYLRPSIRADSLLLKPYERAEAYHILEEFMEAYLVNISKNYGQEIFQIKNEEGLISIPNQDIFYFEAREKKIFARTRFEEYGFYDTMEQLCGKLPEYFIRCHRSYIVNAAQIHKIVLAKNRLILRCEMEIPLSRSYKTLVKEYGNSKYECKI